MIVLIKAAVAAAEPKACIVRPLHNRHPGDDRSAPIPVRHPFSALVDMTRGISHICPLGWQI
jgi:hypothetical protein